MCEPSMCMYIHAPPGAVHGRNFPGWHFSSLHLAASHLGEAYAAARDTLLSAGRAAHLNDLDRAGRGPVRGLCPGIHLGVPRDGFPLQAFLLWQDHMPGSPYHAYKSNPLQRYNVLIVPEDIW